LQIQGIVEPLPLMILNNISSFWLAHLNIIAISKTSGYFWIQFLPLLILAVMQNGTLLDGKK